MFNAGDPEALAEAVAWGEAHPSELERMAGEARSEYETKYRGELNCERLIGLYERAIKTARSRITRTQPPETPFA